MTEEYDLAAIAAFLMGEDLGDVSALRGAMRVARAHLLRALNCLAAEERDSLMDPVHTAVGRALGALTRALVPTAEHTDEGDEEEEWAVAGPHPTAAEEGDVAWLTAAWE